MLKNVEKLKVQFHDAYKSISSSDKMNERQLRQFTSKLSGSRFEIAEELWDHMSKNTSNESTLDEFIKVYFQAHTQLNAKQLEANKMIEDLRSQLIEIENLFEEALDQDSVEDRQVSKFYKQTKSLGKIQLQIEEVVGMPYRQQGCQYVINVAYDSQQFQTRPSSLLKYNQTFVFQVTDPNKEVKITVVPESKFQNTVEGSISLKLSNYSDQNMHNEEVNLVDRNFKTTDYRLMFSIQWIYSNSNYYEKRIKEWQDRIGEEEGIILQLSNDLNALSSILRGLDGGGGEQPLPPTPTIKHSVLSTNSVALRQSKWASRTENMILVFVFFAVIISAERTNYFDVHTYDKLKRSP